MTRARPAEPLETWCRLALEGVCLGRATDRHHLLPRSHGGTDAKSNTVDLCRACHAHIHANPSWAYAHGWLYRTEAKVCPARRDLLVCWNCGPDQCRDLEREETEGQQVPPVCDAGREWLAQQDNPDEVLDTLRPALDAWHEEVPSDG